MKHLGSTKLAVLATEAPRTTLGVAELAALVAGLLAEGDLVVAVADEQRASALALAVAAMAPDAHALFCPGTDALPGEDAPPSPVNVGQRVAALRALRRLLRAPKRGRIALVTTGEALARSYASPEAFDAEPPALRVGQEIDLERFHADLLELGYVPDERVDEPGEVAVRGSVLDVYPADAVRPLRAEVVDGAVVALRGYDPVDQRTVEELEHCELGRVKEPAAERNVPLLDHLPGAALVISPAAEQRRRQSLMLGADAAKRGNRRAARNVVAASTWDELVAGRALIEPRRAGDPPPRFVEGRGPMAAFAKVAAAARSAGDRVVILGTERDLRFLAPRIAKRLGDEPRVAGSWDECAAAAPGTVLALAVPADRGFRRPGILAVAATDLLGSRADRGVADVVHVDLALGQGAELRVGDTLIHEEHGIGVVQGLDALPAADGGGAAIRLGYAKDTTRLVPVAEADRLWRYGAEDDAVTLDTLDGRTWIERRKGIAASIEETARTLTALAAERDGRTAPVLDPPVDAYERFAAGFPFAETPDQLAAIEAVRADLAAGRPMDRIVVGDVGFGKTEVALRAAAVAALAGRQVALAAPTTVLARQHLETFTARFEGTGVAVAGLSRLTSAADRRRIRAGLKDGSIGVVVGTGAVAGKGVEYADLALVIVDEEQRFGAADKQRLADLSAGHVLTLSATPIPRTLQSALVGLRAMSVIATPPARRQPIRTAVSTFDAEVLRAALLREAARGGQSFIVVPRIADMAPLADTLARLVPELELLQAHGKMKADEIDDAMVRFGRGDGDILLATNIIEAGLDVPRANLMAIVKADRFGLSQLHQLRGRVGRGARRGQVLLFTQADDAIAPHTLKRLRTLEAFDRLGAGFAISARDLDLRGAGDLVGDTQAGHMKLIGVELYQQLLEDALRSAKGKDVERWTPDLRLGLAGELPAEWIPEEDIRLTLYARLSRLRSEAELDAFEQELEDRFGAIPPATQTLLAIERVRQHARDAAIARIDAGPAAIALTPRPHAAVAPLDGTTPSGGRYLLKERIEDPAARLERLTTLLGAAAAAAQKAARDDADDA